MGTKFVAKDLSKVLTIVLVTSPVGCHPSTEVTDAVIASFADVPCLKDCSLIVAGDGVKL